jgi:uncharacterized protein
MMRVISEHIGAVRFDPAVDPGLAARSVIGLITLYQRSHLRRRWHRAGPRCRFIPSCSEYSIRALRKYGAIKGIALTVDRLRRCDPRTTGSHVDFP